jgi:hypothetical protein
VRHPELKEIEAKQLKRAVRRNLLRFPDDFMFELEKEELINLRSQFGTSSWGGTRYSPMVFTEQGVAMLSSVLNSERAIAVNIQIIRVFTRIRELVSEHKEILQKLTQIEQKDIEQDKKIMLIFDFIKKLDGKRKAEEEFQKRKRVGFKQGN